MFSLDEPASLVEIREKQPGHPVILIDGHEVRAAVKAVLAVTADQPPTLRLGLLVTGGMDVTVTARVLLDDETAGALVAAGWTPPPGG